MSHEYPIVSVVIIITAAYCRYYYLKFIKWHNYQKPVIPSVELKEPVKQFNYPHKTDGCLCTDYYTDTYKDAVSLLKCHTFKDENILLETKCN